MAALVASACFADILHGPVDRVTARRLRGNQPGQAVDEADRVQVLEALPESGNRTAVPDGDGDIVRNLPGKMIAFEF